MRISRKMKKARKLNPRKLKLAKAIANRSALSACMHTVLHTQNLPNLLSLSAEIHEVPVLHPFIVLCTLWIALHTSTHKLQSILANKRKRKNRPQCESAKINPTRILILAKARKKDPREKKGLYSRLYSRSRLQSRYLSRTGT